MKSKIEAKYEATKKTEAIQRKFVWALPHWAIKWALVRATLHATNGKWSNQVVPKITAVEVLKRWDEPNEEIEKVTKNV